MPKLNMYQSLHTTVVGPGGKPVEIQIRTWDMHRRAEFGIAAHWKYKENGQAGRALSTPDKSDLKRGSDDNQELSEADNLKWIQQLADWTSETPDSNEFLGSLKEDLGAAEVYVFTPKQDRLAAGQCHAGGLRLRRAYRSRAQDDGRARQRPSGAARHQA